MSNSVDGGGKTKSSATFFFLLILSPHLAENPTFVREVVEGDQKRSGWGFLQATTRETKRDGLMRMCEATVDRWPRAAAPQEPSTS
jgi:hypothetical protein